MRANPDFILWIELSQKFEKAGPGSGPRVCLYMYIIVKISPLSQRPTPDDND